MFTLLFKKGIHHELECMCIKYQLLFKLLDFKIMKIHQKEIIERLREKW